jgi:hypothetical protein
MVRHAEIKQIIPSAGWWAVFAVGGLVDPVPSLFRVVCWALIEDEEGQYVTAMIEHASDVIPVKALRRHWGYSYGHTYEEAYEWPKQIFDETHKKVTGGGSNGKRAKNIFTTSFSDESN